jgi:hypothetical protein
LVTISRHASLRGGFLFRVGRFRLLKIALAANQIATIADNLSKAGWSWGCFSD